ncbi:hypothetical protein [Mesorhizobium shangrilense]|uniref:Uncharacterized protein n=1 Tax=Mesorhizobium shangrilense TaxID=460060 RepID=A0ABV2D7T4_9HYPH
MAGATGVVVAFGQMLALPLIRLPAFVIRKAKQLAFRPLRGPLLNSPYSDGEKAAVAILGALSATLEIGEIRGESLLGRQMRGSANL